MNVKLGENMAAVTQYQNNFSTRERARERERESEKGLFFAEFVARTSYRVRTCNQFSPRDEKSRENPKTSDVFLI